MRYKHTLSNYRGRDQVKRLSYLNIVTSTQTLGEKVMAGWRGARFHSCTRSTIVFSRDAHTLP